MMPRCLTISLVFALLCLTACGIKPKDVDSPAGPDAPTFPREYPVSK